MSFLQKCKGCRQVKPCNHKYCRDCYPEELKIKDREKKREKAKQYKKKAVANQKANYKPTGEWEIFVAIWLKREHVCTGCGCKLHVMAPVNFSHTIRTKEDESLRHEEENIELECFDCHNVYDTGTWDEIMTKNNFNKRMEYIKQVRPDLYARKALKIQEHTGVDITGGLG
jgi:hypothetical protein